MIMRKYLLIVAFSSISAMAQDTDTDFHSFRKDMMTHYQGFRKGILDDYADYLGGIWKEFQSFRGEKRNNTPKPVVVPKAEKTAVDPKPQKLPTPEVIPNVPDKPVILPLSKPTTPPLPAKPVVPMTFSFYGMAMKGVSIKTTHISSMDVKTIVSAWRACQDLSVKDAIPPLLSIATGCGLNDWFTFELVRHYVDGLLSSGSSLDRIVLQHFLLANMGYDVRLAKTDRQLVLLVPFKQQMYERSYLEFDDLKYYIFYDNLTPISEDTPLIYTCELPKDIEKGSVINLIFDRYAMNITSGDEKNRTFDDGVIHVSGSVNTTLMEMLRHYPQMDIPCYAESKVIPSFHAHLLAQIKPQISGVSQREAANALLHFMQYAFDYATDQEQHGYEKVYFIEENFYYPKNDCEDRAILYAFLVRNLLGLDVHLVQYPGHVCTAVHFTDSGIDGDSYIYAGETYLICDPTYIGVPIGRCVPSYKEMKPKVELWY